MSSKNEISSGKTFKSLLEEKKGEELLDTLEEEQAELVLAPEDEYEIESAAEAAELETAGDIDEEPAPAEELVKPEAADSSDLTVEVEDVEILLTFIQESQDHLENIEEKILKLEEGNDPGIVADIFRSMHTMKGTSSFLGLEKIKELSHALESVLDDLRVRRIEVGAELVDILLEGTDQLARMIGGLSEAAFMFEGTQGAVEIALPGTDISPVLSRIQAIREAIKQETGGQQSVEAAEGELINSEMIESFVSEARDLLEQAEKDLLAIEKKHFSKKHLDDAFRCIHTLKGNAGFLGFSDIEKISVKMEEILDTIRTGERKADTGVVTILLDILDSMNSLLESLQDEEEASGRGEKDSGIPEQEYKPIGEILVDMGATNTEAVENALEDQERRIGEILVSKGKVSEGALDHALETQQKAHSSTKASYSMERKDIRVDMGKLDKLFNLVGELITAEAMVIHNPEIEALEIESFNRSATHLSKITREMQEITMAVRMIPLEGIFNKMKRLVRDLGRKFGKRVNLLISGQETEMDRNVIEQIADPLVHILRNAIDHGIEDEKNREEKGKAPIGAVSLNARYEGNEIWITIKDDGAGLNREKILAKAEQKGLLKAEAENMKDEEVWELLFEPGFSTAEKVTEVSGRGVGMDVVKRNVEKLRGKITVNSTLREGTEITLKIPLTLAIIDGITLKVGGILYALPLGDIIEFHKAADEQITRTDANRKVLKLREQIIPVIKLQEFFNTKTGRTTITEGILIIAQAGGRKAALLANEIVGYKQIVVKALPAYLGNITAISGCSIMGNGEISLIIDTGSLLREELE